MVDGAAVLMTMFHAFTRHGHLGATSGARTCSTPAPTSTTSTRRADGKYVSIGSIEPQFYAELLAPHRPRRRRDDAQADGPPAVARPEGAVRRRCSRPRPATSGARSWRAPTCASPRCCRMAEAPAAPAQRRARHLRRAHGVVQPAPAPRFSRTPGEIQRPPVVRRPAHRRGRSPTGASTPTAIAKLRETGAIA